jgi:hypothetical protein
MGVAVKLLVKTQHIAHPALLFKPSETILIGKVAFKILGRHRCLAFCAVKRRNGEKPGWLTNTCYRFILVLLWQLRN